MYFSSTARSAKSSSVQRLLPLGGALQLSAMIFASTSPVTFGGTGGVARFFLPMAPSQPCWAYAFRTIYTVFTCTCIRSAISSSFKEPPPGLFSSATSKIWARLMARADDWPLEMRARKLACSSTVKRTGF